MTKNDRYVSIATGDGLPKTLDDAVLKNNEVVGCNKHPDTSLIFSNQDFSQTVICNPSNGDPTKAHVISVQEAL